MAEFDAYDLRITFPDGQIWAVDVKDWTNPVRLARHLRPLPSEPKWHRAFIVPSRKAAATVPGYVFTLRERSRSQLSGSGTEVISEQQLLAQARAALAPPRSSRRKSHA